MSLRIATIGTGALASLFAARLAPTADVVMVGSWPEQVAAVKKQGLRLISGDGSEATYAIEISNRPDAVPPVDVALVLVKSYQTQEAVTRTQALLQPDGVAITLQNGAGNLAPLQRALGMERATLGTTSQGATMVSPGMVRHAGEGETILAPPTGATGVKNHPFWQFVDRLRSAGFAPQVVDDVRSLVWGKLAVNAGINPLTALLDVPNGLLAENETARLVMVAAANEVARVAAAQGIQLPYDDAAQATLDVARRTASNISSMRQDMQAGRQTEIDAICGSVVRQARAHGVATPINQWLWQSVITLQKGEAVADWKVQVSGEPVDLVPLRRHTGNQLKRQSSNRGSVGEE